MSRGLLVIGIGGHAVGIDPTTGTELWRTHLKTSQFVTVAVAGAQVFAGAGGELFCLEAATGRIVWRNRLKGLGVGLVSFAGSDEAALAAALAAQAATAAAATS